MLAIEVIQQLDPTALLLRADAGGGFKFAIGSGPA